MRIHQIFFVNSCLVILAVAVVELVFGAWIFDQNLLTNITVPRSIRVEYSVKGLYPTTSEKALHIRDRFGFRGNYGSIEDIDLITVGGSTTAQRYITEAETFQAVMTDLAKVDGRNLSIANAGVDGQSTVGHLANFRFWFPKIRNFKPRFVLLYVGINDFARLIDGRDVEKNYHVGSDLAADNLASSARQVWFEKSVIFQLFTLIKGNIRTIQDEQWLGHFSYDPSVIKYTSTPAHRNHRNTMRANVGFYRKNLELLNSNIRQFGAHPIFVTQTINVRRGPEGQVEGVDVRAIPSWPHDKSNAENFGNGLDAYMYLQALNEVTMEVCKAADAICLDLGRELLLRDTDFYDFFHTNPQGSRKIGQFLYKELRSNERFKQVLGWE